jgi:hypothetical protein
MSLASDLVSDSKLTTTVEPNALHRKIRQEQHWKRAVRVGEGAYGTIWLEKLVAGDFRVNERAVKIIKKHARQALVIDYSRELEAIVKFSHPKVSHISIGRPSFVSWKGLDHQHSFKRV